MWPFVVLIALTPFYVLTVVFCEFITTLLFNGRVAAVWNRAYFQQQS